MAGTETGEESRLIPLPSGALRVQGVSASALAFIDTQHELGEYWDVLRQRGPDGLEAWSEELADDRRRQIIKGLDLALNYCLTWGVADDPPEEDLELMRAMGIETDNKRLLRLYWLRLVRLDEEEVGIVLGAVRQLSFSAQVTPAQEEGEEQGE